MAGHGRNDSRRLRSKGEKVKQVTPYFVLTLSSTTCATWDVVLKLKRTEGGRDGCVENGLGAASASASGLCDWVSRAVPVLEVLLVP